MSTDYKPEKAITMKNLFDGRLEAYGVHEDKNEGTASYQYGVLTDGTSRVEVYAHFTVHLIRSCGTNNEDHILHAIANEFETKIHSECSPQFWGFEGDEGWEFVDRFIKEHSDEIIHE